MLTESTGGKGTGLGKGRKTKGTQTVDLWSSLARMSDLAGCTLPLIILGALLALPLGPKDKGPVRSIRSDCPDPACVLVTRRWRAGNVSLGLQDEKVGSSKAPMQQGCQESTPYHQTEKALGVALPTMASGSLHFCPKVSDL